MRLQALPMNANDMHDLTLLATVAFGNESFTIPVDTSLGLKTHLLVYAMSTLAEQTTPAAQQIADASASVSALEFVDRDLDPGELGGSISWNAPDSAAELVEAYVLYVTNSWKQRTLLSSLPEGTNDFALAADTPSATYRRIDVFTKSSLTEQSTPGIVAMVDRRVVLENATFLDLDLDAGQFGGDLSWIGSGETGDVASYAVYVARGASGENR